MMKIENAPNRPFDSAGQPAKTLETKALAPKPTYAERSSVAVSISGQTLLRQRVFMNDPDVEPPVITDQKLMHAQLPAHLYLRVEDRQLLAEIYEFAQAESIDLNYVDLYASELADYRYSDNGKLMNPHNQGLVYDLEGHRLSYSFTETDTVLAQRIRTSPSLASTRLDVGFVMFDTDKNHSSMSHTDFEFLELLVNRFSSSKDLLPISSRMSRRTQTQFEYIEHKSKEVYKLFNNAEPPAKTDKTNSTNKQPQTSAPPLDLRATLRQIVHKYLQKSGLPTLFDTLMRLGK
jgi:hypothetical protein